MKPRIALALAVLLTGLGWGYLVSEETPRGQVEGKALLTDAGNRPLPECDIYLTPVEEKGDTARERRHTVTDKDGAFHLRGVPAGKYALSASARWHNSDEVTVTVEEAKTSDGLLKLKRSEPNLSVGDHQANFATDETPFLPVRGYTTGKADKSVRVRIWRTRLSDVLKRSDAATALDELRYSYSGPHPRLPQSLLRPGSPDAPKLIADTTLPVTGPDREGFFVNREPLIAAKGKPGLYLVELELGRNRSSSYLLVSDLALVAKQSPGEMIGYATHIKTGTPVAGATLRYYSRGKTFSTATTDRDGIGTLPLPPTPTRSAGEAEAAGGTTPTLAIASRGDDEAVISQGRGWWGETTEERFAIHTVTDRTIYRPGDLIRYKGIARRKTGAISYAIPRAQPVTVEIRDANGGLLIKETKTTNDSGVFSGSVETSPEGATGAYTLLTQIGDEKHTADIAVAAYRKPEFAVTVTPTKTRYLRGEPIEMKIEATYYFGAPVAGAKVRYTVYRDADWSVEYDAARIGEDDEAPSPDRFSPYSGYFGEMAAEGEAVLDADGRATVRVESDKREPRDGRTGEEPLPQVETFRLSAYVEDEAKRSVEGEGAVKVAAGDRTISVAPEGYVARPGTASQVFVTVHDADGKPVPNQSVELRAAYERWDEKKKETLRTPFGGTLSATTGPDGRAILSLIPPKSGEITLTAATRDTAGRAVSSRASLWATGDQDTDLSTDYGDLSLLTDKRQYRGGETARVLVNASRTGQSVLLTVEGDKVFRTLRLPITKRSTLVELPIAQEWGPNVTLAACYVRNKKFASSETPLRVALAAKELAVTVKPVGGTNYRPGDSVTYDILTRDAGNGTPVPANVSLAVVDESIYALRADDPKALRRTFYPARTNRVTTAFSFAVEYLGDVNKTEPEIKTRKRFRDTAFWQAEVRTDRAGKAKVTVPLPDNLTTWRATVNAVSDETAVGYGIGKVVSSLPFFVRLETPRFLTGGDRSRLLALVHNETGKEQQVRVRLVAPDLLGSTNEEQTITVPAGSIGKATWPITIPANAGPTPVRLTARTGNQGDQPAFTDGLEQILPIRPYGKTVFTTFAGVAGEADEQTITVDAAAIPDQTRLTVRVTPSVAGALLGSLDYLIGYPYGCTEQTMSRFYPDLLVERLGLLTDPRRKAEVPKMVRDGLARLTRFRHAESGGWGWWERDADDPFMTAYVLEGLAAANAQGYPVEPELLQKGREAAVKMVENATGEMRPYLLYALAEAGYDDTKTGILHAPFRYSAIRTGLAPKKLTPASLAYLVLLGRKLGSDPTVYLAELRRRQVVEGRLIRWESGVSGRNDPHFDDRMVTALALRALLATDPRDTGIPGVLRWLMQSRTDNYFGNTRDTAWAMVALCDYLRQHPEEIGRGREPIGVFLNGTLLKTLDATNTDTDRAETTLEIPRNLLRTGRNTLRLSRTNTGAGVVFYSGVLRQTLGTPAGKPLAAETENGVTVTREVLRVVPRKVGDDLLRLVTEPVTDGRFQQGDQLRVRLTVTNARPASYLLIEDAFPAGAEVTERGTAEEAPDYSDRTTFFAYDHVDVRDDRIAFFIRQMDPGKHVIEYNLRAQTPGRYNSLPAEVQAMYDATTHGASAGSGLEIKE